MSDRLTAEPDSFQYSVFSIQLEVAQESDTLRQPFDGAQDTAR
jgi:hypothetical protein